MQQYGSHKYDGGLIVKVFAYKYICEICSFSDLCWWCRKVTGTHRITTGCMPLLSLISVTCCIKTLLCWIWLGKYTCGGKNKLVPLRQSHLVNVWNLNQWIRQCPCTCTSVLHLIALIWLCLVFYHVALILHKYSTKKGFTWFDVWLCCILHFTRNSHTHFTHHFLFTWNLY